MFTFMPQAALMVMKPALEDVEPFVFYCVDEAMLVGYPSAPKPCQAAFKWFRLSNAFKRGTK